MEYASIWSVIVASVVAFVIGALWYSPLLFGKEWMALMGITDKDVAEAKKESMVWSYVIQLIATVITFIVIGFAIAAIGASTARDGAFVGLIAWIGFSVPAAAGQMLWEKRPFKLVLINSISSLVIWIIGGAIIGGWN